VPATAWLTAQAQHAVRELADTLEKAVSPSSMGFIRSRAMPGHMNVVACRGKRSLLVTVRAGTNQSLSFHTDVAVLIGANAVVNPDARDNPSSPIAACQSWKWIRQIVVVLKRGQARDFSGLENPLFFKT